MRRKLDRPLRRPQPHTPDSHHFESRPTLSLKVNQITTITAILETALFQEKFHRLVAGTGNKLRQQTFCARRRRPVRQCPQKWLFDSPAQRAATEKERVEGARRGIQGRWSFRAPQNADPNKPVIA